MDKQVDMVIIFVLTVFAISQFFLLDGYKQRLSRADFVYESLRSQLEQMGASVQVGEDADSIYVTVLWPDGEYVDSPIATDSE